MVTYDTVIPSTNSTEIFYFVRKETTYTYDRDNNNNDDDSSQIGRFYFK
jgi:hypothetical protein